MGRVGFFANVRGVKGFKVAGPTATRVELGVGSEERRAATNATINACLLGVPVAAGKWSLGAFQARDGEFLGAQKFLPFRCGFLDFFHMITYREVRRVLSVMLIDFKKSDMFHTHLTFFLRRLCRESPKRLCIYYCP